MRWIKISVNIFLLMISTNLCVYTQCQNIRNANLKNHVYPLKSDDFTQGKTRWGRMVNGIYEEPHSPMNVAYLYLKISDIAFGDLNGDGREEAAVTAIYGSNSGSFYLTDTYIFNCVAGKIKLIGILKQERIEKDSGMDLQESVNHPLRIKKGVLYITHGTEGNRPSPEFTTTFAYKIKSNKLVPYGYPLRRRNY